MDKWMGEYIVVYSYSGLITIESHNNVDEFERLCQTKKPETK